MGAGSRRPHRGRASSLRTGRPPMTSTRTTARLAVAAATALAAARPSAYTFVGPTSQFPCQLNSENVFCGTVNVFMAKSMKRVNRLLLGFEATCQAPDKYFATNLTVTGLPAKRSAHGSTWVDDARFSAALGDNLTANVHASSKGRVQTGKAGKGSFTIDIDVVDGFGQTIDRCTTGRQSFAL